MNLRKLKKQISITKLSLIKRKKSKKLVQKVAEAKAEVSKAGAEVNANQAFIKQLAKSRTSFEQAVQQECCRTTDFGRRCRERI